LLIWYVIFIDFILDIIFILCYLKSIIIKTNKQNVFIIMSINRGEIQCPNLQMQKRKESDWI
jgi:hypothetical protein